MQSRGIIKEYCSTQSCSKSQIDLSPFCRYCTEICRKYKIAFNLCFL